MCPERGRDGSRRRLVVFAAAALAATTSAGFACTALLSLDEVQCSGPEDCRARGAAFANATCAGNVCVAAEGGALRDANGADGGDDPWSCLDQPPTPSDPSLSVDVEFTVFDTFQPHTLGSELDGGNAFTVIDYAPLPGTTIYGCDVLDLNCHTRATPTVVSDDAGVARLTVRGGDVLFYHVERSDSFPSLYYPGRLLANEPVVSYPVSTDSYSLSAPLEATLGTPANRDADAGLGHVFATVFDCADRPVAGVSVQLVGVAAGVSFYLQDRVPIVGATVTDSVDSTAGFVNVPEGLLRIRATLGRREFTVAASVQSASTTFVDVRPRHRAGGDVSITP
jgi:hypothetical protein